MAAREGTELLASLGQNWADSSTGEAQTRLHRMSEPPAASPAFSWMLFKSVL